MRLRFNKMEQAAKHCQKRKPQCVNNATYEVTWKLGHGLKVLCTKHKNELEKSPDLLRAFFKLGTS
jgi:hypothetical protein